MKTKATTKQLKKARQNTDKPTKEQIVVISIVGISILTGIVLMSLPVFMVSLVVGFPVIMSL